MCEMELVKTFGHLPVVVQLALIVGSVTIVLFIGSSRRIAENLAFFLRSLRSAGCLSINRDQLQVSQQTSHVQKSARHKRRKRAKQVRNI